jgi:hypothetical protein
MSSQVGPASASGCGDARDIRNVGTARQTAITATEAQSMVTVDPLTGEEQAVAR